MSNAKEKASGEEVLDGNSTSAIAGAGVTSVLTADDPVIVVLQVRLAMDAGVLRFSQGKPAPAPIKVVRPRGLDSLLAST